MKIGAPVLSLVGMVFRLVNRGALRRSGLRMGW